MTNVNSFLGINSDFIQNFKKFCEYHEWSIKLLNEQGAIIQFRGSRGQTHNCIVVQHGNVLEFSVPSNLNWQTLEEIPNKLSSYLLGLNAKKKIGFWCYQEIENKYVLSRMTNESSSLLYSDVEHFGQIVNALVLETDQLESSL